MNLKTALIIIAIITAAFSFGVTVSSKGNWEGFVYYDKNNLSLYQPIGGYETLDQCREFSLRKINEWGNAHSRTYECGYNCSIAEGDDLRVCEKVSR